MLKLRLSFLKDLPECQKRITLSTCFTLARLFLVPFIVASMIYGKWNYAFWLFIAAAITDVVDGLLARMRGEETSLGAMIDPIADKTLMLAVFATLAFFQSPLFAIPTWFVWLVLLKESILVVGTLILFATKGYIEIQPTLLSKATTLMETFFIAWLFACYFFNWVPIKTYYAMLGGLLLLIFLTLFQYLKIGKRMVLGT